MQSKPKKLKARFIWGTITVCAAVSFQPVQPAEFATLFTTPQERQIINSNRYKSEESTQTRPTQVDEGTQPMPQQDQEEVTQQYRISGITISKDGPHTVWINALAYEDGEQLEDSSKIKVMVGDEIKVRITAPDGKQYYATSGDVLEVTYLAPVQN
jgi:hypothetical protein